MLSAVLNMSNPVQLTAIPARASMLPAVIHRPLQDNGRTLIMSHGFRGSKDGSGKAVRLAEMAADIGFTVVRYDFTPGQSLSMQVAELTSVIAFCRQHTGERIILLGRSMGGCASLACAAADPSIEGLALWATPCNLTETFQLALGKDYALLEQGERLKLNDSYGTLELKPEFICDFAKHDLLRSMHSLADRRIPVLVLHGTADEIVPIRQARLLYETAVQPKTFVQIDGGDHQFTQHGILAADAVTKWLTDNFLE